MAEIKLLEEKVGSIRKKETMLESLKEILDDPRCPDGFLECMQCATCVASCPAARIYEFNPREMMRQLYEGNLEELLKGDRIWECGQCYTCMSRCPRGNNPGGVIMILRYLSCWRGHGLKKIPYATVLMWNLYTKGYSLSPDVFWDGFIDEFGETAVNMWKNMKEIRKELGYLPDDARMEPIPEESMKELRAILDETLYRKYWDNFEKNGVAMKDLLDHLGSFDYYKPAWKEEK
ncbi:MAG: 4Fe-4S dicluster domain-containing protein [bacterium]|nr:4Fe-4S dicluster domain-containing protein [bacterium]